MVSKWPQVHQVTRVCVQDNVALIAVLEALDPSGEKPAGSRRQLLCVANTHIHANPELSDVKLWQARLPLTSLNSTSTGCAEDSWLRPR